MFIYVVINLLAEMMIWKVDNASAVVEQEQTVEGVVGTWVAGGQDRW